MVYFTIFIASLISLISYVIYCSRYWKRKNVPHIYLSKFEISPNMFKKPYEYFKSKNEKYFGIMLTTMPLFIPIDIDLIKNILNKDFNYFNTHGVYYNEKDDPLSGNLFNVSGNKWKILRTKLTPTFTSGKAKIMFNTILECSKQMLDYIDSTGGKSIDIKEVSACFTTDIIGSCAFGIECNSFVEGDNFRKYGKKIFVTDIIGRIKSALLLAFPKIASFFHVCLTSAETRNFFINAFKQTVEYREKNNIRRKDFLQLLIDMKNNNVEEIDKELAQVSITFEELAAQCFAFFAGGFETSSTTLTFCLYELAVNQDIQNKVRNEINNVLKKYNNEITYDAIMEMKYMQQVIDETLRKYPPLVFLFRKCSENYKLPDTDVIIEKGTTVFIPAYQIQHDEEYYPNAENFDPERFSETNKQNIKSYTFLPFGEGPRICIALRFGVLLVKVGLTSLLAKYKFNLDPSMKKTLTLVASSAIISSKDDILLKVEKIER